MDFNVKPPVVKGMYETTFLTSPELSEDQYKKVVSKFEKLIKDHQGEIINLEHWGLKKTAFPIRKHNSAYYTFVEFTSPGDLIKKLEQEYIYDETVIRYLTCALDKHAIAFNKKRRDVGFGDKSKTEVKAE